MHSLGTYCNIGALKISVKTLDPEMKCHCLRKISKFDSVGLHNITKKRRNRSEPIHWGAIGSASQNSFPGGHVRQSSAESAE